MKPIDLRPVYKKYKGYWVGLKGDTNIVVSSGRTLGAALRRGREKGIEPTMMFIPKNPPRFTMGALDFVL